MDWKRCASPVSTSPRMHNMVKLSLHKPSPADEVSQVIQPESVKKEMASMDENKPWTHVTSQTKQPPALSLTEFPPLASTAKVARRKVRVQSVIQDMIDDAAKTKTMRKLGLVRSGPPPRLSKDDHKSKKCQQCLEETIQRRQSCITRLNSFPFSVHDVDSNIHKTDQSPPDTSGPARQCNNSKTHAQEATSPVEASDAKPAGSQEKTATTPKKPKPKLPDFYKNWKPAYEPKPSPKPSFASLFDSAPSRGSSPNKSSQRPGLMDTLTRGLEALSLEAKPPPASPRTNSGGRITAKQRRYAFNLAPIPFNLLPRKQIPPRPCTTKRSNRDRKRQYKLNKAVVPQSWEPKYRVPTCMAKIIVPEEVAGAVIKPRVDKHGKPRRKYRPSGLSRVVSVGDENAK